MLTAAPDKTPKQNEQPASTIRKSEERLMLAMAAGSLISWETDTRSGAIDVSGDARNIIGFDVPQRELERLMHVHPDDAAMVEKAMQYSIATREPLTLEHRLTATNNGEPIWVKVSARFIDDHRLIGITQNIDARKKSEIALRESEERFRTEAARLHATLQSISDAVYIGDTSGITLANQSALDQLGYSNYEDLNKNIGTLSEKIQTRDAVTGEIISPEHQAFARALCGEHVTQNVKIKHLKSGEERILRSSASPVIVNGEIVSAIAVNTDITKQWLASATLQKRQEKLREFNDSLEQQVKVGSDELTELLLKQKQIEEQQQLEIFRTVLDTQEVERKRIAETLHNSLGQILYAAKLSLGTIDKASVTEKDKENLKNANKLLNDAITESRRLSHELMPVILQDFGLKTAIEDICKKLNGKTQFKCRFKGSVKQLDKYLEVAIYRLVQELLMNVVKHAEASNAFVAIEVYADRIVVLVQDNGRGFNALKEKTGGIGHRTIRNNVNLLKGNINITSKTGKGTVINIDIPFKSNK